MVLLETIHTLRTTITQDLNFEGESQFIRDSKIPKVHEATKRFAETITELSKQKKIMILRPSITISEHHSSVLKKIKNYFGYIITVSYCPYCKKGRVDHHLKNECPACQKEQDSIKKYKYKGLGHADIEHAFLAKNSGAPLFYTTDKSFYNLNDDKDFTSLKFIILPNPVTMAT